MKVYELMNELAKQPSGAEVYFHALKSLKELPKWEDDLREIDIFINGVELR
jgi:hypothetical protein